MSAPPISPPAGLDELLACIRSEMDLESEDEHDVLVEIRGHLEEAVAAARAEGLDEEAALARAAACFGAGQDVGRALQHIHAGRATADAVVVTALPVLGVLVLRWLLFPARAGGPPWTPADALGQPAVWVLALAVLLIPLLQLDRPRYARVLWAIFWCLSVVMAVWPALS